MPLEPRIVVAPLSLGLLCSILFQFPRPEEKLYLILEMISLIRVVTIVSMEMTELIQISLTHLLLDGWGFPVGDLLMTRYISAQLAERVV